MMEGIKYSVEFRAVDEVSASKTQEQTPSDATERRIMQNKEAKPTEEITKEKGGFNKKAFAKFMIAYGFYKTADSVYSKVKMSESVSRGDNLSAVMQGEKNAVRDSIVSTGLTLVGGAVIGGPAGLGAAALMEAYKYANQAINIGIANANKINQILAQRHVAINEQERFIRNSTTDRIRSW